MTNQKAILVGTPCYGGLIHQDYFQGTLEQLATNIPIMYMQIGNESLITRGRNTIISTFFHNTDKFSHLLFLDADVYLSGQSLKKMLDYDLDVVAAPVPLKGFNQDGTQAYNVTDCLKDSVDGYPDLVTVSHVGTAALLLSSKVVTALVDNAKKNNDVYMKEGLSRGEDLSGMENYDIFKATVVDGKYLAEDYYLCHVLRELGYDIFVDKTIRTRHSGTFTFQG
jgi:hypothetical protein